MVSEKTISESWLHGACVNKDLVESIKTARHILKGSIEDEVREIWNSVYEVFIKWKNQNGEHPINSLYKIREQVLKKSYSAQIKKEFENAEPWECAGIKASNPLNLLKHLEKLNYRGIEKIFENNERLKVLAAMLLHEAALEGTRNPEKFMDDHLIGARTKTAIEIYNSISEDLKRKDINKIDKLEEEISSTVDRLKPIERGRRDGGRATAEIKKRQALNDTETINNYASDYLKQGKEKRNIANLISKRTNFSDKKIYAALKKHDSDSWK